MNNVKTVSFDRGAPCACPWGGLRGVRRSRSRVFLSKHRAKLAAAVHAPTNRCPQTLSCKPGVNLQTPTELPLHCLPQRSWHGSSLRSTPRARPSATPTTLLHLLATAPAPAKKGEARGRQHGRPTRMDASLLALAHFHLPRPLLTSVFASSPLTPSGRAGSPRMASASALMGMAFLAKSARNAAGAAPLSRASASAGPGLPATARRHARHAPRAASARAARPSAWRARRPRCPTPQRPSVARQPAADYASFRRPRAGVGLRAARTRCAGRRRPAHAPTLGQTLLHTSTPLFCSAAAREGRQPCMHCRRCSGSVPTTPAPMARHGPLPPPSVLALPSPPTTHPHGSILLGSSAHAAPRRPLPHHCWRHLKFRTHPRREITHPSVLRTAQAVEPESDLCHHRGHRRCIAEVPRAHAAPFARA